MQKYYVAFGDMLALLVTTLIGFLSHGEAKLSFLLRFLAAFLPITLVWFLLAPWFGLFQREIIASPKQLWRPALVILFAAPLAGVFRGLILRADIAPLFVIVFGATSAIGMIAWRALWYWMTKS
jgi:hypothetical protein